MSVPYVDPDLTNPAKKMLMCALIDNGNGSFMVEPITGTKGADNLVTLGAGGGGGGSTIGTSATPNVSTIQSGTSGTVADVTAGKALKVDGSAITQPVSGTVTANVVNGYTSASTTTFTVTTVQTICNANTARKNLIIYNDAASTGTLLVSSNATPTQANAMLKIIPGTSYEPPGPIPFCILYAVLDAGTGTAHVTDCT